MTFESREPPFSIAVGSPDDVRRTVDWGFTIQGLKTRHRQQAERMRPGDTMVTSATGLRAFTAIATTGTAFFGGHELIWVGADRDKAADDSPFRNCVSREPVLPITAMSPADPVVHSRGSRRKGRWRIGRSP